MATLSVEIAYAQLAVFDAALASPFNDWTDAHVLQGFAWRPGRVSFRTLDDAGALTVEALSTQVFDERKSKAQRVILVPFTIPRHGNIEVASIGSGTRLHLQPGEYELTFEHGRNVDGNLWAKLYFVRTEKPVVPRILRADAELRPPAMPLMTANPA
jgi:Competence protein J (ComJ)